MAGRAELPASQRRALAGLSRLAVADELYLAGGAGVAIHLGHRTSRDLDLFGRTANLDLDRVREQLATLGRVEVVSRTDATLHLRLDGADVDVVRYPYAPLTPPRRHATGVRVASLRDLAAMKLAAIARRGVKRDYWDLYAIFGSGRLTLRHALDDYQRKFGLTESDVYHVLRALSWFEDADRDDVFPRGLTRALWSRVRAHFEDAARRELERRVETTATQRGARRR